MSNSGRQAWQQVPLPLSYLTTPLLLLLLYIFFVGEGAAPQHTYKRQRMTWALVLSSRYVGTRDQTLLRFGS